MKRTIRSAQEATADIELQGVLALLGRYSFASRGERGVQDAIERIFVENEVVFTREHILGHGDRPDFMVKGIAVEVKVGGPSTEVIRQLRRYAADPAVQGVLLVTTRFQHVRVKVGELAGKPVGVFLIPGGLA